MKDADPRLKIQDMLSQCLMNAPHVRSLVCRPEKDLESDLTIEIATDQGTFRLIVRIRNNGQPRYAREAVALLSMKLARLSGSGYAVFAAPFISDSAAEICRESGAGYIDLAGNCRLAFDGIYIERQGRPNRFVSNRSLRSLYQARSSRVLRALLFNPDLTWKLADLSEAAGVSIGQVFNVKKLLVDREWAGFGKDGLKLVQPEAVLRDWSEHYEFRKNAHFNFHSPSTPAETESRLAERLKAEGLRYALTSFSASARLVPAATPYAQVFAYVDGSIHQAAALLDLNRADSGQNVTLMLPYDEGVFYGMKQIQGINLVSQIQAYLDLAGLKESGEDAAEALFTQVIQKGWRP